ncbi:guanine deaminase [Rhodoferax sp.]|uniref:guanine deaminase n=1 Tax=Rhodoferax sp. TaxID=50421 RepID=UPI002731078E|nr:guanine deaminase [Rhodoferax sp.]MDP1527985.1 guanine deaminase [Rhodoferax sp.]MDP1942660.1 guanine deaminase [Rhodoferax sp.]MDP2439959.1 guanine deaminase [Rhodoferax sp.]MDZ4207149.1 guanine deaminase [Rhodoferax sp.]
MKAYRAAILRFATDRDPGQSAIYESDGLLVLGPNAQGREVVQAVGPWHELRARFSDLDVTHWPGRLIAPGFVDLHSHYPQTNVIGSPAEGLLPWLENYTFPEEKRFASPDYSTEAAQFFIAELLRQGVTTALTFATSHPASVQAFFAEAQKHHMRLITGLCLMDRHAPAELLNQPSMRGASDATEQSLLASEALIQRWHGVDRLGYAITPRFAPTSSNAQLRGAGELAARHPDVWIQSHVAENHEEIAWARDLFPASDSYLSTYADFGLLRERAIYAHCIHFDDADRAMMRDTGAAGAVCPTSNLFLGSGFFDYAGADRVGFQYGLASDVGGGTSFSPFHTMLAAYTVGREGQTKPGLSLSPQQLWWQHTAGAAQALGLAGVVGNLQVGCEADFVVLNPQATPLLARRTALAESLDELLFAMIVLGDDRLVERTIISQAI